ncbi:MAG: phage tail protein [Candidatus Sulfopaludibacter sp.]|nr:phage tail protein [Candidatus Sulfopaludibacter sp.]
MGSSVNIGPVAAFNFRVLFSAPSQEQTSLDSGDALAAAATQAAQIVPSAPAAAIKAGFSEVSGLNSEVEIEDYREGGRNIAPHRLPRWGRYPHLVLRRGITTDTSLWDWWSDVITHSYTLAQGAPQRPFRRSGLILLDGVDHRVVAAWFVSNALPERLAGSGLNARSSEIAIETLELSHEGLFRLTNLPSGV